jgi:hypothetical protein
MARVTPFRARAGNSIARRSAPGCFHYYGPLNTAAITAIQEAFRALGPARSSGACRDLLRERANRWFGGALTVEEVVGRPWAECQEDWHRRHAAPSRDHCAGCGCWMIDDPGMSLPDGAVVHLDGDCLVEYGRRWRVAATLGLKAMGLEPKQ